MSLMGDARARWIRQTDRPPDCRIVMQAPKLSQFGSVIKLVQRIGTALRRAWTGLFTSNGTAGIDQSLCRNFALRMRVLLRSHRCNRWLSIKTLPAPL
jgi:hypothetical protein